jgi:4-amino-4-deoxy-L-arabinose transferase-like glycosyltransferase
MDIDFQFVKIAKFQAARHPLTVIGIFLLVCLVPFINKAIHMDDPLFIWTAEWILKHPGDFYGFHVNWYGDTSLMATINCNPPATAYYLAGAAGIFGWREIVLHGAFLPVAFAAGAGIYQLAKIWCGRPLLATLVALVAPVFLVSSTTLMCDVPMLAFWVWSVVLWERALNRDGGGWFLAAGILAGLAVLTKYSALTFLPLLLVLGVLRKRRAGWWLLWFAVPAAMIAAYQFGTANLYGRGLISAAADYAATNRLDFEGGWGAKCIIGLAFVGGCLLPTWFLAPWLWSRLHALVGGVLAFGLSLGALLFCVKLGPVDLSSYENAHWGFVLQAALLMTGGIHLVVLTVVELWRRRDTVAVALFLWILGGCIFATALNWTINARSLLPIMPAAAILVVRRLERENPTAIKRSWWWCPLILSAVVSLCVAAADFDFADSAKTAARQIMAQYQPVTRQVWFEGHWGFQYYMKKFGARPIEYASTTLQIGDILVAPPNNSNVAPPAAKDAELLAAAEFAACSWLGTIRPDQGAGFYDAQFGPLPFVAGPMPPEKYCVYKVLRPFQFTASLAASHRQSSTSDWHAIKAEYESVLRARPNDAPTHAQLAFLLQDHGELAEAIIHYRETLRIKPDQPPILNNFAWLLASCPNARFRDGAQAVKFAERACALTHYREAMLVGTLAAAYAEAGRFDKAVATAQKACVLASEHGEPELLKKNQELLELYRQHQPYHETVNQ